MENHTNIDNQVPPQQAPPQYGQVPPRFMQVPPQQVPPQQGRSMSSKEGAVGKIVMAILASVFLVVSIGIFAAAIFPNLSDFGKLMVSAVISGIFYVIGLILTIFKKENKVHVTLLCCGAAMLYMTLLVYYQMFEQTALFPILGVFCLCNALLAKKLSSALQFTAEMAMNIVLLSVLLRGGGGAVMLGTFVTYLVTLVLFFLINHQEKYHTNWMNWVSVCVATVVASIRFAFYDGFDVFQVLGFLVILVMVFAAMGAGFTCYWIEDKHTVGFGVYNSILFLCLPILLYAMIEQPHWLVEWVLLAITSAILVCTEIRLQLKYLPGKLILQVTCFVILAIIFMEGALWEDIYGIGILAVAFYLIGFLQGNMSYKIAALVYTILFLIAGNTDLLHLGMGLVIFAVVCALVWSRREQYKSVYKIFLTLGCMWLLAMDLYEAFARSFAVHDGWMSVVSAGVLIAVLGFFGLSKNWNRNLMTQARETETFISVCVCGAVEMLYMAGIIDFYMWEGAVVIALIVEAIVLWSIATGILLKQSRSGGMALAIAVLWALLILYLLAEYQTIGYIISLVGIVYAGICIAVGFVVGYNTKKSYAPLRIFGLVLVLLSLLKLLVIDIHYPSLIARAISFFAAGIMCMGISFLYSFVEKKMKKEIE